MNNLQKARTIFNRALELTKEFGEEAKRKGISDEDFKISLKPFLASLAIEQKSAIYILFKKQEG